MQQAWTQNRLLVARTLGDSAYVLVARGTMEFFLGDYGTDDLGDFDELKLPAMDTGVYVVDFELKPQLDSEGPGDLSSWTALESQNAAVRRPTDEELAVFTDGGAAALFALWSDVPSYDELLAASHVLAGAEDTGTVQVLEGPAGAVDEGDDDDTYGNLFDKEG